MTILQLKRAYSVETDNDGYRVYVDRLWPRGLSHQTFQYDMWEKSLAPSTELRKWYHSDPEKNWEGFKQLYTQELLHNPALTVFADKISNYPKVTLLFSSHDVTHNDAPILAQTLVNHFNNKFVLA